MADLSWAVKKQINDKKVIILVDYYGNGRLIIDDICIMVYDGCFQHGDRLLKYGWSFCTEKDDPEAIIQRGNYKGGVHMCDKLGDLIEHDLWLDLNKPLKAVEENIKLYMETGEWLRLSEYIGYKNNKYFLIKQLPFATNKESK